MVESLSSDKKVTSGTCVSRLVLVTSTRPTYAAAPDLSSTRLMKAILELSRQKHFARFVFVGELPLG